MMIFWQTFRQPFSIRLLFKLAISSILHLLQTLKPERWNLALAVRSLHISELFVVIVISFLAALPSARLLSKDERFCPIPSYFCPADSPCSAEFSGGEEYNNSSSSSNSGDDPGELNEHSMQCANNCGKRWGSDTPRKKREMLAVAFECGSHLLERPSKSASQRLIGQNFKQDEWTAGTTATAAAPSRFHLFPRTIPRSFLVRFSSFSSCHSLWARLTPSAQLLFLLLFPGVARQKERALRYAACLNAARRSSIVVDGLLSWLAFFLRAAENVARHSASLRTRVLPAIRTGVD